MLLGDALEANGDPTGAHKHWQEAHRLDHLHKNVRAMDARARMAMGESFSFAKEARLIFAMLRLFLQAMMLSDNFLTDCMFIERTNIPQEA